MPLLPRRSTKTVGVEDEWVGLGRDLAGESESEASLSSWPDWIFKERETLTTSKSDSQDQAEVCPPHRSAWMASTTRCAFLNRVRIGKLNLATLHESYQCLQSNRNGGFEKA